MPPLLPRLGPWVAALVLASLSVYATLPARAFAAEVIASGANLVLPWGDLVAEVSRAAFAILAPILVTYVAAAVAKLFPALRLFVTNAMIDRMVRLAADYALNAVAGAAKGRVLTVPVGKDVVAEGVARAINSTAPWVVAKAGGTQGIAERLFRHLDFVPEASTDTVLAPALKTLGVAAPVA